MYHSSIWVWLMGWELCAASCWGTVMSKSGPTFYLENIKMNIFYRVAQGSAFFLSYDQRFEGFKDSVQIFNQPAPSCLRPVIKKNLLFVVLIKFFNEIGREAVLPNSSL